MKHLLSALLLMVVTMFVSAQEKTMLPEQQRLSVLKGHWTLPGSESSYLEICEWIQGNHIQCRAVSKEGNVADSSVSYLSYSPLEKTYIYYGLYSSGNSRTLRGNWNIDRFIFEGQRVVQEKTTKWKVTMIPMESGDIHFIEEVSINNAALEKKADFIYKKLK